MKNLRLALFIILNFSFFGFAQDQNLIQFSGVVVDGDSLRQIPFTSIIITNTNRGTTSDYYGYFSFVAQKGDTLKFSHLGYTDALFVIPDSLTTNRYSLIQMMQKDTFLLKETFIYPWPTIEQFKEAFLNLQIPEDDYVRAQENLARAALKEQIESTPMNGSENYNYQMRQRQSRLYYTGQAPPINILNPIAWAQFIEAWKKGDFKKQ